MRDTSNNIYDLLDSRDNWQHSERSGHYLTLDDRERFRFDVNFDEF